MSSRRTTRSAAAAAAAAGSSKDKYTSTVEHEKDAAPPAAAKRQHRIAESATIPGLYTFALQGNRGSMEDTSCALITEDNQAVVFGVFDGHGGGSCSLMCKERLCQEVAEHAFVQRAPRQALTETFVLLDEEYCDALGELDMGAGSTATACVLRQTSKPTKAQPAGKYKLTVAWAGDSSAVVLRRGSAALLDFEQITNNHNGSRLDERRRIEKQGGYCDYDEVDNIYRVDGVLAVTRSLGDVTLKPHVCAQPEIRELLVRAGDLVIVASDGLWDFCHMGVIVQSIQDEGVELGLKHAVELAAKYGEDNVCAIGVDVGLLVEGALSTTGAGTAAADVDEDEEE